MTHGHRPPRRKFTTTRNKINALPVGNQGAGDVQFDRRTIQAFALPHAGKVETAIAATALHPNIA
jgi:hypothetical protein